MLFRSVPIAPPPAHPFSPLLALRAALAAAPGAERGRAIDALFDAAWRDGRDITEPASVRGVLDAAGLDGHRLLEAAGQPDMKAALRSSTDAALARGVFGVPSFAVDEEVFWGQDSLPHLERWLEGRDPAEAASGWAELPEGVRRRAVDASGR